MWKLVDKLLITLLKLNFELINLYLVMLMPAHFYIDVTEKDHVLCFSFLYVLSLILF